MSEIIWEGAVAQAAAIRRGETTAVEILDEYLDRIERYDPQLRAYVAVDAERAEADAAPRRRAGAFRRRGPAPVPGRDDLAQRRDRRRGRRDDPLVEGARRQHARRRRSARGSPAARRFILLGKTNVPEFCTSMTSSDLNGICRNPWDLERTPSGSSGGAGAVARGRTVRGRGTAPTVPDRSVGRPRSAAWSAPSRRVASSRSVRKRATRTTARASTGS